MLCAIRNNRSAKAFIPAAARCFSKDEGFFAKLKGLITIKPERDVFEVDEHLSGVSKDEVETPYNNDPIFPDADAGSKEKPIEVPSNLSSRIVGFELPESHGVMWFNLEANKLHYVTALDRYFVLKN